MSEVTIRPASHEDAPAVAAFCQPIYAAVYPNAKYGLKPEHFSPEVFQTDDTLDYFAKILALNDHQRAYLAESGGSIVGSISIERMADCYELHNFYVSPDLRGRGIGKRLMREALTYCVPGLPIHAEVAETNLDAIKMYEHWGFKVAPHVGVSIRHWPEWPEGLHNVYLYMEAGQEDLHAAFK